MDEDGRRFLDKSEMVAFVEVHGHANARTGCDDNRVPVPDAGCESVEMAAQDEFNIGIKGKEVRQALSSKTTPVVHDANARAHGRVMHENEGWTIRIFRKTVCQPCRPAGT
ncbi:MAG TPA: hypothetical protein DCW68_04730 [Rhodospirillaceae bacterium]|nr:hypothetical protein [Rhodospirillaceae bacterium]